MDVIQLKKNRAVNEKLLSGDTLKYRIPSNFQSKEFKSALAGHRDGLSDIALSFHSIRILPGIKNIGNIYVFTCNPINYLVMTYDQSAMPQA